MCIRDSHGLGALRQIALEPQLDHADLGGNNRSEVVVEERTHGGGKDSRLHACLLYTSFTALYWFGAGCLFCII